MKNHLFVLLAFGLLFLACRSKKQTELLDPMKDQMLLEQYFTAATVGVISNSDVLKYMLKEPVFEDLAEADMQEIIQLDPKVPGKVSVKNGTLLVFTPEKALRSAQTYTVRLNLKALNSKRYSEVVSYKIKTIAQDMSVDRKGFLINDDRSAAMLVTIQTADKADIEELKSCFKSNADDISITETGENRYEAQFTWKSGIKSNSFISYDGQQIDADNTGIVSPFEIDTKKFELITTSYNSELAELHLYFSQQLSERKDMTGYIYVNGQTASYAYHDNVMKVFLGQFRNESQLKIEVSRFIPSKSNQKLPQDYFLNIDTNVDKPAIEFVGDGNYFPSEGDFKIPVRTRALKKMRLVVVEIKQDMVAQFLSWQSLSYTDFYTLRMYGLPVYDEVVTLNQGIKDENGWTVHGIDLTQKINKNPGSIYYIAMEFAPEYTTLSCAAQLKKYSISTKIPNADYFKIKDSYYRDYYYYQDGYNWKESNDPCKLAYYVDNEYTGRMFICSDYSVVVKKAGTSYHVALSDLMELSTVKGADVTLFTLQGAELAKGMTDGSGFAVFENIREDASVLKVSKNNKVTYLALDGYMSNSLTEFNIEGERSETDTEFFVYTEREVYRPGDTIHVDLMLNKSVSTLPAGIPMVLKFFDTDNLIVDEQVQHLNPENKLIYSFMLSTPASAKTGTYRCVIQVGSTKIKKNIRIETIKPNTTEVLYTFDNISNNTIYSDLISGDIHARYLTGFDLSGAKISATAKIKKIANPFLDFGNYRFDAYFKPFQDFIDLYALTTDGNGNGRFKFGKSLKEVNGPFKLYIDTETTLADGGTSKEGKSVIVSPLKTYVGLMASQGSGWSGNYTLDENIRISVINVNNKGKLLPSQSKATYRVIKNNQTWWIDKYNLGSAGNYMNEDQWEIVEEKEIVLTGKTQVSFPKGKLSPGAYMIEVIDEASGHMASEVFSVYDGRTMIPGKQPYIVEFQTDKEIYQAGDPIQVVLPGIVDARALISIERGNKVIKMQWANLSETTSTVTLETDENWAPNAYIHITIMQKYKQENNDLPLRMYGIKYVKMNGRTPPLTPVTNVPNNLESNKAYTFTVSEQTGQPMEYTIAIVDEGLLNLTGFATPDPVKHFNGKYPLLVKTWDVYQYLMSYFRGKFAGIISIGGDDVYNPDAIAEINRFKPVTMHLGPFKVDKGGKNTHRIYMPGYVGKVRMMVVACNSTNFGKLEKLITVKNALMIQSQLPRSLNVSDKIKIPVSVFRDDKSITHATLTANVDASRAKGFTASSSLTFSSKDQITHFYNVEVQNTTGKLPINLEVKSGNKSMSENTDLFVNYPNAYESSVAKYIIESNQSQTVTAKVTGYPEVFTSKLIISGIKMPNFVEYAADLIDYPYGCVEQISSRAFSLLYIDKVIELDPADHVRLKDNLKISLEKIRKLQRPDGKFKYWESDYYHAWSDIYAGNLLTEMKRLGQLSNNNDMLDTWIAAHTTVANNWSLSETSTEYVYEYESLVQAYRLFVLAKAGKAPRSALNRFVSSNNSVNPLTWWLLAGSFKLNGYDSKASELMSKAENLQKDYSDHWSIDCFGDKGRDWAIIVEVLSYLDTDREKMELYYNQMVDILNTQNWVSTQTKGYAFIAAYNYYKGDMSVFKDVDYSITGSSAGKQSYRHSSFKPKTISINKADMGKPLKIKNDGKGKLYVYQISRYIDNQIVKPATQQNLEIHTDFFNNTRNTAGLSGIQLGDDIVMSVAVENPNAVEAGHLALNVKMPSGWELINPRIYESKVVDNKQNFNYQDFRDDRVYTFFKLKPGEKKIFNFKAKAAFSGDFYLPAVSCEHMYNGEIYARTATGRVNVK